MPVLLNRHFVVPEVVLHTPSGPFLLTRYNVWVDEADLGANLTIGLSVIEAMGYTTQVFLDVAARACSSLDLEVGDMSATDDDGEAPTLATGDDAVVRGALTECVQRAEDRGLLPGVRPPCVACWMNTLTCSACAGMGGAAPGQLEAGGSADCLQAAAVLPPAGAILGAISS